MKYLKINPNNKTLFVILTLTLLFLNFLGFGYSLKYAVILLITGSLILSFCYKSLFVGFFLLTVFAFQILSPYKYYEVEVIRGNELINSAFDYGRNLRFGVNSANILTFISVVFMVGEILKRKKGNKLNKFTLGFVTYGFVFLLFSTGVSVFNSALTIPSLILSIHYSQIFVIAGMTFYLYGAHRKFFNQLFTVIYYSVVLQTTLSISQFFLGSGTGLPIEIGTRFQYLQGMEESNAYFRAMGTFNIPVQLAYLTIICLSLVVPFAFNSANKIYLTAIPLGFVTVILTQSRINWFSLVLIVLLIYISYKRLIHKLFISENIRKVILYFGIVISTLSFVVIPRTLALPATFSDYGGITLRKNMILEAFDIFLRNPLFGFGPGTNEYLLKSFYPDGVIKYFPLPVLEGHLQMLLELGIFGLLLFAAPFYFVARKAVLFLFSGKFVSVQQKSLALSFVLGTLAGILYYMFQSYDGITEFTYLGVVLGFGAIAVYNQS